MAHDPSEMLQFVGRFHPLLVHLPIGFIVLLAALELLGWNARLKQAASCRGLILALTAPAAALAALCGWLLSQSGDYEGRLLSWHKWMGISVAVAAVVLLVVHWRGWARVYRVCLFATLVVLAVASHLGGSLTHGSDYLTQFAPKSLRRLLGSGETPGAQPQGAASSVMARPVYAAVVQPILAGHCIACHGPGKSKGKLRLDTLDNLLEGGDSGPVVTPGSAADSLLVKRLLRPVAEEEHMPPAGKPQLLYEEIVLMQWWIDVGAPADKSAAELNPPENVARILESKGKGSQ
jgi:uncharacterized membrane protein